VHIIILTPGLNHLIILFCRELALHGVDLLPLAHALALGTIARPHKQGPALYFPREITLDLRSSRRCSSARLRRRSSALA
jgi:hypothetical protein